MYMYIHIPHIPHMYVCLNVICFWLLLSIRYKMSSQRVCILLQSSQLNIRFIIIFYRFYLFFFSLFSTLYIVCIRLCMIIVFNLLKFYFDFVAFFCALHFALRLRIKSKISIINIVIIIIIITITFIMYYHY